MTPTTSTDDWRAPDLRGKVALVTGASRGAGRGIARVLGQCGMTVYVTARSSRGTGTTQERRETIEDAADEVTAQGGRGIPVRCDHTDESQVKSLLARIEREQGRLDLLVNNAWAGYERTVEARPFWEIPLDHWDAIFDTGLRGHFLAAQKAAPLLLRTPGALIVSTTSPVGDDPHGHAAYEVAKSAVPRLARAMAHDLEERGVTVVSLAPGWMRTERVLEHFGATEDTWRKFADLAPTESPQYIGRAIAHLAADPARHETTGNAYEVGQLARTYGFTDVDGRRVPPFSEVLPGLLEKG